MLRNENRPLLDLRLSMLASGEQNATVANRSRKTRMPRIFGLDIGTTSIGFAVIDHTAEPARGEILRLGVRIFPEARNPKGTPLNQERRQARTRRRQLRRRRERRRFLGKSLIQAGLLPSRHTPEWNELMKTDPYDLRRRAFEGQSLGPYEAGRAIYHLAQRRHFKGSEIDGVPVDSYQLTNDEVDLKAASARANTGSNTETRRQDSGGLAGRSRTP